MLEEARRFCDIVHRSDEFGRQAFVAATCDALLAVVETAFAIPSQGELSDDPNPPSIADDVWRAVYERIGALLDDWDGYWTAEPQSDDPLAGELYNLPLSDDLADIWRDLKEGLLALDEGGSEAIVLWHWKFTFEHHWGRHASEALRVLTQLRLKTP